MKRINGVLNFIVSNTILYEAQWARRFKLEGFDEGMVYTLLLCFYMIA
jgi:hypothetical protein